MVYDKKKYKDKQRQKQQFIHQGEILEFQNVNNLMKEYN